MVILNGQNIYCVYENSFPDKLLFRYLYRCRIRLKLHFEHDWKGVKSMDGYVFAAPAIMKRILKKMPE